MQEVYSIKRKRKMKKIPIWDIVFKLYLIMLGVSAGMILALGALSAPVVFHANDFLNESLLSHYQMGLIMSEIFDRFSYILLVVTIFIAMFEWRSFWYERDKYTSMIVFIFLSTSFLFMFYYLPDILKMQALGEEATQTKAFLGMHMGSELAFQVVLFALLALLFRRISRRPAWLDI